MGAIKNFYHEEICKQEFDRFEESEHFNNYKQLNTAIRETNGKEKQGNKGYQNGQKR